MLEYNEFHACDCLLPWLTRSRQVIPESTVNETRHEERDMQRGRNLVVVAGTRDGALDVFYVREDGA